MNMSRVETVFAGEKRKSSICLNQKEKDCQSEGKTSQSLALSQITHCNGFPLMPLKEHYIVDIWIGSKEPGLNKAQIQTKRGHKEDTFLQKRCRIFWGQKVCLQKSTVMLKEWLTKRSSQTLNWPQVRDDVLKMEDHLRLSKVMKVEASRPCLWMVELTSPR